MSIVSPTVLFQSFNPSSDLLYLKPDGSISIAPHAARDWHRFLPFCFASTSLLRKCRDLFIQHIRDNERLQANPSQMQAWIDFLTRKPIHIAATLWLQYVKDTDIDLESWLNQSSLHKEVSDLENITYQNLKHLLNIRNQRRFTRWQTFGNTPPNLFFRICLRKRLAEEAHLYRKHIHLGHRNWAIVRVSDFQLLQRETSIWAQETQPCTRAPRHMTAESVQREYIYALRIIENCWLKPNTNIYALFIGDKVRGLMALSQLDGSEESDYFVNESHVRIWGLVVHPHSQQQGIGKSLLCTAIRISRLTGCAGRVALCSSEQSESFYKHLGFNIESNSSLATLSPSKATELHARFGHLALNECISNAFQRAEKSKELVARLRAFQEKYDPTEKIRLLRDLEGHVMLSHFFQRILEQHESMPYPATPHPLASMADSGTPQKVGLHVNSCTQATAIRTIELPPAYAYACAADVRDSSDKDCASPLTIRPTAIQIAHTIASAADAQDLDDNSCTSPEAKRLEDDLTVSSLSISE